MNELAELPVSEEDAPPELPPTAPPPEEAPPQEEQGGAQEAIASIFANPQDLHRYHAARAAGASESEALKVGDNGIGKWNDVTATYKIPMVALPTHTPGIQPGRLIKVDGPNGSVVAKLADVGAPDGRIDLNPAAAMAVGHNGGLMPVKWQYVDSKTAGPTAPTMGFDGEGGAALPESPQSGELPAVSKVDNPTAIGSQFVPTTAGKDPYGALMSYSQWFNALEPGEKDQDGAVIMRNKDGTAGGKLYPGGSFVWEVGGHRYAENGGQITELKGTTRAPKTADQIAEEAAARKNVTRSHYPEGPEGDRQYEAAKSAALNPSKPKIYRDAPTGLAFDISNPREPKPLNLPGNPASVDITQVKTGDWSSVPDELREVAQNIANYKYPKISGFALRSPYFQQLLKIVSKVDPTFSAQEYDARQKFLSDFSAGKIQQNRIAFTTALDHMARALGTSEEMEKKEKSVGNTNQITNGLYWKTHTAGGATEYNNFLGNADTFVNEYIRATTGAAPTVEDKKAWNSRMTGGSLTVPTADQRKSLMSEMAHNIGSRLGEIQRLYEKTMKRPLDISLLSPESEEALSKLGAKDLIEKFGSQGGKRPYADPEANPHSVVPFPGSDKDSGATEHEIVEDQEGHRFIVSPDGKLIPYGQ